MPHQSKLETRLILLPLLTALLAPLLSTTKVQGDEQSRYHRVVMALQTADQDWKVPFAEAAISQLVEVYLAEADLASFQAGPDHEDLKLSGWSRAVERYANQLLIVQEDARQGYPVELYAGTLVPPRLVIAGRSVILSHPREDQQVAYEQLVLTDFCRRANCDQLVPPEKAPEPEPIPVSAPAPAVEWQVTDDGPRCEGHSVSVIFSRGTDLQRMEPLCKQVLHELSTLRSELQWQQRHGVALEPELFETRTVPGRPVHLFILNQQGDSLLLELPLLHTSPGLMRDVNAWLLPRQPGESRGRPLLQAGDYGWE